MMITHDLNVCVFPMQITWDDITANLNTLRNALKNIHPQTDLVVIPETFSTGFPVGKTKEQILMLLGKSPDNADLISEQTAEEIRSLAAQYNLAIAGSMVCSDNGSLYNRGFIAEPNGDISYGDKHHLFSMAGEDEIFTAGDKRLTVRYRGWNISLVICYDLRFPVWCRNVNNDYDLLVICANWPEVRISAWNKLLPARAIENESYLCACNCSGVDNKEFIYDGGSDIIDYKGNSIAKSFKIDESTTFLYATLSRAGLDSFREKFPAWRDNDAFTLLPR